ncbi:MAG: ABC transporter ATP-binding protein [Candidatus Omnitrophota bacterium]
MIQFENIDKIYPSRRGDVYALRDVTIQVKEGEFIVLRGPSGSGKSTLLLAAGGMLRPSNGRIQLDGRDIYAMSIRERARFRAEKIGFVFQMFHLVSYLTVMENVLLAAGAVSHPPSRDEAAALLKSLGLAERETHKPTELSAGEKQRCAIARALLNKPKLLLADEPTGNLDPENASEVLEHLSRYHREGGTVLVVTHGAAADRCADRIIRLQGGRIEETS